MIEIALVFIVIVSILINGFLFWRFQNAKAARAENEVAGGETSQEVEPAEPEELDDGELKFGRRVSHLSSVDGPLFGTVVLIADDIPENIEVLIEMLGQMVLTDYFLASNGKQAISLASNNNFDLVFMDIQMPIMNGLDAAENIKAMPNHHTTPIIPLTAHSRVVTRDLCKKSGMFGFLQKPIDMQELREAIEQAILSGEAA
ncbi:MAG: response regulator [Erythrobacter sp.]